jgi:hypothetical protein
MILLKAIRTSRRTPKPKAETKKAPSTSKPKAELSLDALLASASPELIESLLSALESKGVK